MPHTLNDAAARMVRSRALQTSREPVQIMVTRESRDLAIDRPEVVVPPVEFGARGRGTDKPGLDRVQARADMT